MSGNNGWVASNNPCFLKLIRIFGSLGLGCPTSSASRIIRRSRNGAPPQYAASYFAKYQRQLGNDTFCLKSRTPPQFSKTTLRTASGVLLRIVSILGSPFGVGNGSAGRSISLGLPETSTVASVTGYLNCFGVQS